MTRSEKPAGSPAAPPAVHNRIDEISTRWAVVGEPLQFVMRYGPAIKKYLHALIPNEHDAEDVCQEFLTRSLTRGFPQAAPDRGRFRKYLKAAVRNAALEFFRQRRAIEQLPLQWTAQVEPHNEDAPADQDWLAAWRNCLLDRAWSRLHRHERTATDCPYHTVLRVAAEFPDEDQATHARRVAERTGRPMTADAYRQQLRRARRLFAKFLYEEVAQTLEFRSPAEIEEELADLHLLQYVREFLPAGE